MVRDFLYKLGLLYKLRNIYTKFKKPYRDQLFKDKIDSKKFDRFFSNSSKKSIKATNKRILFYIFGTADVFPLELLILQSFIKCGYEPYILGCNNKHVENLWLKAGIKNIIKLNIVENNKNHNFIEKIDFSDFDSIKNFTFKDVGIGDIVIADLFRNTKSSDLSFNDENRREKVKQLLKYSLDSYTFMSSLVDEIKPSSLISYDVGYSPRSELFNYCLTKEISCYTVDAAHKNNHIIMKKYNQENKNHHPFSLSSHSWNKLRNYKWNIEKNSLIKDELINCYNSKEWMGSVGTQSMVNIYDKDLVLNELNLFDKNLKVAIIYPHIFWDATFSWGESLYSSYEKWFVETVRCAIRNKNINWIIKIHPANIVKAKREGLKDLNSEVSAIKKNFKHLPKNIKLLPPNTKISTLALHKISDYCITVRGTVGLEASCFGSTVLTAGTGRYDRLGFTLDSDNIEQYEDRILNIHKIPKMGKTEIELACKFAFGVFLERPIPLSSINMIYKSDEKSTLETKFLINSIVDLDNGVDTNYIKRWIESGKEDFLVSDYKSIK